MSCVTKVSDVVLSTPQPPGLNHRRHECDVDTASPPRSQWSDTFLAVHSSADQTARESPVSIHRSLGRPPSEPRSGTRSKRYVQRAWLQQHTFACFGPIARRSQSSDGHKTPYSYSEPLGNIIDRLPNRGGSSSDPPHATTWCQGYHVDHLHRNARDLASSRRIMQIPCTVHRS